MSEIILPQLLALRPNWLPEGTGLQAEVTWTGKVLRIGSPRHEKADGRPAHPMKLEEFFWRHSETSLFNLLPRDLSAVPPLLEWLESAVLYGHTSWEAFLVSAWELPVIQGLRFLKPNHDEVRIGVSIPPGLPAYHSDILEVAHAHGAELIQGDLAMLDLGLAREIRARGLGLLAENVNGLHDVRQAIALGADGITTEQPTLLLPLIDRLARQSAEAGIEEGRASPPPRADLARS